MTKKLQIYIENYFLEEYKMNRFFSGLTKVAFTLGLGFVLIASPAFAEEADMYVKFDKVPVYYAAGSEHIVDSVNRGDTLLLEEQGEKFTKVSLDNGLEGFVPNDALTFEISEKNDENADYGSDPSEKSSEKSVDADKLIAFGKSKLGCRYSYGSRGPNTFDCSGFVGYTYENALGKTLPRSSGSMSTVGRFVPKAELQKGDLVFFNTGGSKNICHVGIYIEDGNFIHASSGNVNKVIISNLDSGYYANCYNCAKRVID